MDVQAKGFGMIRLIPIVIIIFALAGCERGRVQDGVADTENGSLDGTEGFSAEAFDTDQNDYLDREEFCVAVENLGLFTVWDTNNSGIIEAAEVSEGLFDLYDMDDNGYLDVNEWGALNNDVFKTEYTFGEWDTNNNSRIDETEFWDGFSSYRVLSTWDDDQNGLNPDEFCSMVFSVADESQDGQVEFEEYDDFAQRWY